MQIKKNFFTGLVILLPVTLTLLLLGFLINLLTRPFTGYVEQILSLFFNHVASEKLISSHTLILLLSKALVIATLFLTILFLGFLGQKIAFRWMMKGFDRLFLKIPVVRTIFKLTQEVTSVIFSERGSLFEKSAITPFPSEESLGLGFVVGDAPKAVAEAFPEQKLKVLFVPTAPHPISGYLLFTQAEKITEVALSSEEMFKILISCGLVDPRSEK